MTFYNSYTKRPTFPLRGFYNNLHEIYPLSACDGGFFEKIDFRFGSNSFEISEIRNSSIAEMHAAEQSMIIVQS